MAAKLTVDKAGRIVLPKPVRDRLQLEAGDTLELEMDGERINLRPVRPKVLLKKELGIWVFQGEACDDSIADLIDRSREARLREVL
jgi:AbrB family looped-hinge helix DNA binding protein